MRLVRLKAYTCGCIPVYCVSLKIKQNETNTLDYSNNSISFIYSKHILVQFISYMTERNSSHKTVQK